MSENKLKNYLNEKAHFSIIYVLIFAALLLCIAAAVVVLVFSGKNSGKNEVPTPTEIPAAEFPVFEGIDDPSEVSATLASLSETHTEWTNVRKSAEMDGIYFITGDDSSLAVYNVDMNNICEEGYMYLNFDHIWVDSQSTEFYTCINISGKTVDLSRYYILVRNDSSMYASRAIFNCYEAETVILDDTVVTGTLLAPNAEVQLDGTYLYGQIYCKNFTGSLKYYEDIPFGGYDTMVNALVPVEFETSAVKQAAIDSLKSVDPMTYSDYRIGNVLVMDDLNKIESLELNSLAIITLGSDLENFNNLTSLSLKNSCVKHLDLSGFTKLLSLDISYSSVDFRDLSKCPNIRSLSIAGLDIKDFDLSLLPNLVYLDCSECSVTNESFSAISVMTELSTLLISGNPELTEADFSRMTKLSQVNINDTGITSPDFSKNIGTLVYLCCSNTGIEEIDLSSYINLAALEAYGIKTINVTGLQKNLLKTFLHDETAVIIDNDPPVSTDPLGPGGNDE